MTRKDDARPERSRGERLDETIDRVAGTMTSVASDPALVARIARRLEADASQAPSWPRLGFAAAGVAAAVIVAIVVLTDQRGPQPREAAARNAPGASHPAVATQPSTPAADRIAHTVDRPARPRRARSITHEAQVPQIAALPSPELLSVDGIATDPLTVFPVDLAPLDLANLALTDADSPADPKE